MNDIFESQVLRLARGAGLDGIVMARFIALRTIPHSPRPQFNSEEIVILREQMNGARMRQCGCLIPEIFLGSRLSALSNCMQRNVSKGEPESPASRSGCRVSRESGSRALPVLHTEERWNEPNCEPKIGRCPNICLLAAQMHLMAAQCRITRALTRGNLWRSIWGKVFARNGFSRMNKRYIWLEKSWCIGFYSLDNRLKVWLSEIQSNLYSTMFNQQNFKDSNSNNPKAPKHSVFRNVLYIYLLILGVLIALFLPTRFGTFG